MLNNLQVFLKMVVMTHNSRTPQLIYWVETNSRDLCHCS